MDIQKTDLQNKVALAKNRIENEIENKMENVIENKIEEIKIENKK